MGLIKNPDPDESLRLFGNGIGQLTQDGQLCGHVTTSMGRYWSPFSPLRWQHCVWIQVIWADGSRERQIEEYEPWMYVAELRDGYIELNGRGERSGRYDFSWLFGDDARQARAALPSETE